MDRKEYRALQLGKLEVVNFRHCPLPGVKSQEQRPPRPPSNVAKTDEQALIYPDESLNIQSLDFGVPAGEMRGRDFAVSPGAG